MSPEQLQSLIQSIGSIAEMSLIFFNSAVSAGADVKTATALTEAFIRAMVYNDRKKGEEKHEQAEDES